MATSFDCAAYVHNRIVGPAFASVSSSIGGGGRGREAEEEEEEMAEAWEEGGVSDSGGEAMEEDESGSEGEEAEAAAVAGKASRRGVGSSLEMGRLMRGGEGDRAVRG